VVDEVLAVGDAEFQKKCLGKMGDVAGEGRTVLFVSHNMQAIQNLCQRALVLHEGDMLFDGQVTEAVNLYLESSSNSITDISWDHENAPGNENIILHKAWVKKKDNHTDNQIFTVNDTLEIAIEFDNLMKGSSDLCLTIHLRDERNILVFVTSSINENTNQLSPGRYIAKCYLPKKLLNQGNFTVSRLLFVKDRGRVVFSNRNTLTFDVIMPNEGRFGWMGRKEGVVRPELDWSIEQIL